MADNDAVAQVHMAAADVQQQTAPSTKDSPEKSDLKEEPHGSSLFGGWGLPDINAVTGSLGNLFGDDSAQSKEAEGESADRATEDENNPDIGKNLGKVAAGIAADATKEFEQASKAAQETIGKAAEGFEKGWGTLNNFLDDMLSASAEKKKTKDDGDIVEGEDIQAQYHSLFPDVDPEDDVVDHYACSILQKYRCYLNNATPERTFPMRGRLFVTTSNMAMHVFDAGEGFAQSTFSITVPFADVIRVQKGAKSMMRVITKSQTSFIFGDFESETHFSASLSLVEHMIESNLRTAENAVEDNDTEPGAKEDREEEE